MIKRQIAAILLTVAVIVSLFGCGFTAARPEIAGGPAEAEQTQGGPVSAASASNHRLAPKRLRAAPETYYSYGYPVVTKNPTDESVEEGGSCWFVAYYENAIWAVWHFVSPDGRVDLPYDQINTFYPKLEVTKGYASTTQLKNIPLELNGWKVYCRFSNEVGITDTSMATIYVRERRSPSPKPASGYPIVTKSPTDESVEAGGSCWFVANYDNAIWAEWHFVSPEGWYDITYDRINTRFPGLVVTKGYASTTQLKNIPLEMNGWRVYCRFSNHVGATNTAMATIYVTNNPRPRPAPAPSVVDKYMGTYVDPVARQGTITIGGTPDIYRVSITWPNGYGERSTWFFTGHFDKNGKLNYSDCIRTTTTYDRFGNATDTTVYSGGSGVLEYSAAEGGIYWTDYEEAYCYGDFFEKT